MFDFLRTGEVVIVCTDGLSVKWLKNCSGWGHKWTDS